jgi:amino-acid N-acetyltransferase
MRNVLNESSVLEGLERLDLKEALVARKAGMRDIPALLDLINFYAAEGIMLPRTEFEISENIRDFTVAYSGSELLGCGALHFYTPTSAEIRSLAVTPTARKRGVGFFLTSTLEQEAIENNLSAIFAFTYVPDFFRRLGFHQVDRGLLPLKVWKDCLSCPKFQCCDEIAVMKVLRGDTASALCLAREGELVQLPVLRHG